MVLTSARAPYMPCSVLRGRSQSQGRLLYKGMQPGWGVRVATWEVHKGTDDHQDSRVVTLCGSS